MTEFSMEASIRKNMAKSHRKNLLEQGRVPAVVYGKALGSIPLEVVEKDLQKAVRSGKNTIINLAVSGNGGPYKVMVRELQYDPVRRGIIHADFRQISLGDSINTSVDIGIAGEAAGGLTHMILRSIEVSCLPANIPDRITVDVTGMLPGDSVAVRDLDIPKGVKVITDPDSTVVAVMVPNAVPAGEVAESGGQGEKTPESPVH